jgi:hypothetical protein
VVRIFTSSTFKDMLMERNTLIQGHVTPHPTNQCLGGEDIHKFHLHRHADGEEHTDIGHVIPHPTNHCSGGEDIHKFHLHGQAEGEEHADIVHVTPHPTNHCSGGEDIHKLHPSQTC